MLFYMIVYRLMDIIFKRIKRYICNVKLGNYPKVKKNNYNQTLTQNYTKKLSQKLISSYHFMF